MGSVKVIIAVCLFLPLRLLAQQVNVSSGKAMTLEPVLKKYVDRFNSLDSEYVKNYVSNADAFDWLKANVPLLDCPDSTIEQTYYYRWWTFRKHLKETPDGFIFTEFITPVKHAGRFNALSCAFGHHVYEGRWLRNTTYLDQYIQYWYLKDAQQKAPRFHQFSSWAADAVYNRFLVDGDSSFVKVLLQIGRAHV